MRSRTGQCSREGAITLIQGEAASTSQIADALGVQPAAVSGMVKRLAEAGYVEHVPYRGVRLVPEATREALRIIRRHRILEAYLSQRLGYSWDDVHTEAERPPAHHATRCLEPE